MNKNSNFLKYMLLITYGIVLYLILSNLEKVENGITFITGIFLPLIIGIAIAFVLNLLLKLYENKLLVKVWQKQPVLNRYKRGICVLLTYLTTILLIVALIGFVIPQFWLSMSVLFEKMPGYIDDVQQLISNISNSDWGILKGVADELFADWKNIVKVIGSYASEAAVAVINYTVHLTGRIIHIILGLIFSVYLLFSKEKLIGILRNMCYAYLDTKKADRLVYIGKESNNVFASFIGGQLTEACILGTLCFIGLLILGISYAPLIAVVVGVTSLIPIIGAYIGVVPSVLILLMEKPIQALVFIIFIILLQQFEGNVIYPRVVGNAIGLDGFWVLLAITLGGGLAGVLGMLLGVPLMAVIYTLVRESVYGRLNKT